MCRVLFSAAVAAFVCAACITAPASQIAFDTAGDSAYNGPLQYPLQSGGYGWGGAWSPGGFGPFGIGSSTQNGSGDPFETGDVNSPRTPDGRAWRLVTPSRIGLSPTDARRPFSGALLPGQTFIIDFDTGFIDPRNHGEYDVAFGGSGNTSPRIALSALPHISPDYLIGRFGDHSLLSGVDSGIPLTDQGIHIELTVVDPDQVQFSLTSLAPGNASASLVVQYSTPITYVDVFNDSDGALRPLSSDLYFNNVAITPEPPGAVIIILASLIFFGRRPNRLGSREGCKLGG